MKNEVNKDSGKQRAALLLDNYLDECSFKLPDRRILWYWTSS